MIDLGNVPGVSLSKELDIRSVVVLFVCVSGRNPFVCRIKSHPYVR